MILSGPAVLESVHPLESRVGSTLYSENNFFFGAGFGNKD